MAEFHPMVSVCLITYNHAPFIKQALEGVLMQKVNFSWEIIIADDCSTDGTEEIISEYSRQNPHLIKLLLRQKNVGPGKNFVDLIKAAKGKYIAYLEGDDYWIDANKLQKQFQLLESNPSFSLCYHRIKWQWEYCNAEYDIRKSESEDESNMGDPPVSTIHDLLSKGWFIRSNSMFFKNFALPENFEKLYVGDFPLHVLLASSGNVGFIDECMGVYRIHKRGMSETKLISQNFDQFKLNFRNHISMLNYLNKHTQFKYNNEIKGSIFNYIYTYCLILLKNHKRTFIKEFIYIIKNFGLHFVISGYLKHLKTAFLKRKSYQRQVPQPSAIEIPS